MPGDVLVLHQQARLAQESDNLAILTSLGASSDEIEEGLQCWSVRPQLCYMLPGCAEPVNEMLSKMVVEGYIVEKGEYHVPPRHLEQNAEDLCEQGVLSSNGMRGYALTKHGMQTLSLRWCATAPRPACRVRVILKKLRRIVKKECQRKGKEKVSCSTQQGVLGISCSAVDMNTKK